MATGDQTDMFSRLKSLLPRGWFPDSTPLLDGLLWGYSQALAWLYSLYLFAQAQTRIKTATGGWLDIAAQDFFGNGLVRYSGQSDDSYRNRIVINIFRERATRYGMQKMLTDLTGRAPLIVEPARPADVGCLGVTAALGVAMVGSYVSPYQAFVTAYRPQSNGAANWPGINTNAFGMALSSGLLPSTKLSPTVSDADIIAAIEATRPAATAVWYRISN
ncbi:hypothetical protein [Aquitalea aquatica]|uniref:Uncharacterized protein n=1 Tax=Aquitalea aquatica TaxID=3044273 RepID=A0A838Y8Y6_9NEIS|nr:hypothetical protein [Aquitalea magnusonii]MBA4707495.1 hypothetical protein [Aquitalea magnusonii]